MTNFLMTFFGIMVIGTFSSEKVLNTDNLNVPTQGSQLETLKEDRPLEMQLIELDFEPLQDSINGEVGSSGSLDLGYFEDIKLEGIFTEIKDNPYVELSTAGEWKALKAGSTEITVGVELTDETITAINNKYPDRKIVNEVEESKTLLVNFEAFSQEGNSIGIDLSPTQTNINALVGDSGKLDLGTYEDIQLEGIYTEIIDNPYIQLYSDGTWKAVKKGETSIYVAVQLTDETKQKLNNKYPDKELVFPTMPPKAIAVTIGGATNNKIKEIGISLNPLQDSIHALVGDSGKLDLGIYEDIQLEGVYTEIMDNPYIQLYSDGTWKAVKAGETTITVGVSLSDKTLKSIKEKYPEGNIIYPAMPPKRLKVIVGDSDTNENDVHASEKVMKPSKELPKTGSSKTNGYFQIFGVFLLVWIMFHMKKKVLN